MKKANARQRILDTASQLFHEKGYVTVGINEIIAKAETAKATFYQHFPSKEALGEAWLQRVHDRSEDSREEILSDPETACVKVSEYFQELRQFLKNGSFRGCPYTNMSAVIPSTIDEGESLRCQVVDHKKSVRKFFVKLAGGLTKEKPEAKRLGDVLFLLYSGATTEAQNLQSLWPVDVALVEADAQCAKFSKKR